MPDRFWRRLTQSRRALLPLAVLTAGAVCAAVPSIATAAPDAAFATDIGTAGPNTGSVQMSQYKFGAGGTLVPNGSVTTDAADFAAITPNARFLYDDVFYGNAVDQFAISSAGTLSPLTPAQVAAGPAPDGVATSPDGTNVYVANSAYSPGSTAGSSSISVYRVGTGGTLTSIQTITSGVSSPAGIAVSPDGASVYVADPGSGKVLEYNRAGDGTLTPKPTASISAPINGAFIGSLVMTPDGQNLYASSAGGSQHTIAEYSVGAGGQLSPKPTASVTFTGGAYSLTVSPNGHNLYAPSCDNSAGGKISQFSIGSGGELAPLSTPSVTTSACTYQVWMNAAGSSAYATVAGALVNQVISPGDIAQFDVSSTGALTPKTPATVAANGEPVGIVIPPDQGPVAAFSDTPGRAGHATKFDASASSDSDGTVARYDWSFGDGTSLANGSATPSHTYAKAGTYQVTVTTTDDSGCSTGLVFTGQTAYCNAAAAAVTHTVKIAAVVTPKTSKLTVRPGHAQAGKRTCFTFRFTSHGHGVRGAKVRFAGHTTHTTSSGRSRVCLALHRGRYTAHASKHGYRSARATVRITAPPRPPAFTG